MRSFLCAAGKYGEALPLLDKASHYWQLFKPAYPSAIKAGDGDDGRPVGTVHGPMRPLTAEQKKTLRKELEILGAFDGSEPMGW
jgi:dihydrodipicolinate synthase/N-acetylneuraminate lyase